MNFLFKLFLVLIINNCECDGYRILAIFPYNSRSHNNVFEGMTRGLAKRGHQVDVVSHFEMINPPKHYRTIISLSGTRNDVVNNFTIEFVNELGNFVPIISRIFGNEICELLNLKEIQKLIKTPPNDPPYDVLITQSFTANCFLGIGFILKIPVITVSASLEFPWTSSAIGNPDSIAFAPNVLMNSAEISTFWKRMKNLIINYRSVLQFRTITEEIQTEMMRKYLKFDMPDIRETMKSTALTFVNSFHSLSGIRIRSPALIDIAGIHLEDAPLTVSKELGDWLDESKKGVVYFSLGSLVVIETLPKETLLAIFSSFKKIAPVRVVMKIVNKEKLPFSLPSNVLVSKWIPQLQVLKHKNTKLFITHGGLMSTLEALYYCVPLIGIPLFYDQFFNVGILVKKNMAIELDINKLTEHSLDKALTEILNNPIYRESAKYESRLFHDRPMNSTEAVNFWVEYVIRNGPDSLKSPAVNLYWWQHNLLDVYGFLILCCFLLMYFLFIFLKYVLHFILIYNL
ncbi:UDP-glucosyltransferase 2-like [Leptopilina boulardi]|uniref:UDP-glucosyltransferase 2-like n=1 Tax=Leptopilina boulardi TaxID=63433 RepID=UPI0021F53E8A|nr:UDP-glucosyltransferase 2-like [Leptopilina boulardi]